MRDQRMRPLGSLLGDFLRNFQDDADKTELFLRELWPDVVGPELARRTRPLALRCGRLEVGVPAAQWVRELEPFSQAIRDAVNQFWGTRMVLSVEFRVSDFVLL